MVLIFDIAKAFDLMVPLSHLVDILNRSNDFVILFSANITFVLMTSTFYMPDNRELTRFAPAYFGILGEEYCVIVPFW